MSDCDGECCDCCHYGGHGKLEDLESKLTKARNGLIMIRDVCLINGGDASVDLDMAIKLADRTLNETE